MLRVEDPATGEPVGDLKPYLGAAAHAVVLDAAAETFVHTHGEQVGAGGASHADEGDAAARRYGPEIAFHHTFPRPGLYKLWGQFQTHDDRVVTADFVVRVQ